MPQTLLLADDSVTIQRVIELTFADEDIKVVAVSDGDQAIARIEASPPDIVLADVGMPGKNGYEVAAYIKQSPRLAHIPVILLTGAFEPVDQVKATAAGCDGVLAKPFEPQLVIGRVRELLGRPAQAASTADASLAPPASIIDFLPARSVEAAPAKAPAPAPAPAGRVDDYFDRLDAAFASFSHTSAPEPVAPAPVAAVPVAAVPEVPDELDWIKGRPTTLEEAFAPDIELAYEMPELDLVAEEEPVVEEEPLVEEEPVAAVAPPAAEEELEELVVPEVPGVPEVDEVPEVLEVVEVPAVVAAPAVLKAAAPEPAPLEPPEPLEPLEPAVVVNLPPTPRVLPSIADAFAAILSAEQNALGVRPAWPAPAVAPPAAAPPAPVAPVITDELIDRIARRVIDQLSDRVVRETVASIASDAAERLVKEEIERIKASIK